MNAPTPGNGATWISLQCGRCRHHYLVRNEVAVPDRVCPLCGQGHGARPLPGFRIRALLDAAEGQAGASPSPSG